MADDPVSIKDASGATIPVAADDVGSARWQYVKAAFGADGTATKVDASNPFPVTVISSSDVQGVDAHDVALTADPLTIGGYASAAAPTGVSADADAVRAWFLRNGAQCVNVTAGGALIGGDATNGLDVDVTRIIPGTAATELGKAEDAVHASGDVGVMALAVRKDTASSYGADGDYSPLSVTSNGSLRTDGSGATQPVSGTVTANIGTMAALVAGTANIGDVDVLTLPGAVGSVAHDAAASGSNPVLNGFRAGTVDPTAVSTNGDLVNALASVLGKLVVLPGALLSQQIQGNLNEQNTTASDVIAAQASGIKIAVMSITVTNKHATVDSDVTIRDGTTAKWGPQFCKAAGGGFSVNGGGFPLFIGTAATAVTALASANADLLITITGYTTTE